jgi:hypothetical protein
MEARLNGKLTPFFVPDFICSGYKMGYWSDILAVAPNAPPLPGSTPVGRLLQQARQIK